MDGQRILEEIKSLHVNTTTLHPMDEQRITRLFYNEMMSNGWYGGDEVDIVLNSLPSEYERVRERIMSIALVIQNLKDQP